MTVDGVGSDVGGAESTGRRLARARELTVRVLFGDRPGLAVFLASLCFVGLYWRVGFFINDSITLANGLAALDDGHLAISEAAYRSLVSPGMHVVGDRLFARNYGQIVLSLPVLWALEGLASVFDPGLVPAALWSLLVLGLSLTVGRVLDRRRTAGLLGSGLATGAFLANLVAGRPLSRGLLPVFALQLTAALAAALAVVTLYRLLTRMHGRRVGIAAAGVSMAATPVGFWATIPKRHVFTVAVVAGVLYALYRSRTASERPETARRFRLLAYVLVGLYAWVHAAEALVLLVTLVAVDLPTARSNDRRTLSILGAGFALSLVPFFVTNVLISGDPLTPPRMLESFGGDLTDLDLSTDGSGATAGGSLLPQPFARGLRVLTILLGYYEAGLAHVLTAPGKLGWIFVRGGYIQSVSRFESDVAIYLTVLESAPVLAGSSVVAAAALRRVGIVGTSAATVRDRLESVRSGLRSAARPVDAYVALVAVSLTLLYAPLLPIHAQVTVRYLLALFPLGVYAMARHSGLRRVLETEGRLALGTWAAGVCIGAQVFFLAVAFGNLGLGESFQMHALAALGVAGPLAVVAALTAVTDRLDRLTAVGLGLAAALGTDFLLLSGLVYFQYGQYALPAVDALAELLSLA